MTEDAMHYLADGAVGAGDVAYIGASLLGLIHGVEGAILGALLIYLTFIRIRSHVRRDRVDKLAGRQ